VAHPRSKQQGIVFKIDRKDPHVKVYC
jgi:hypothetical protein